ncbi:hypothetical protein [Flavobacterium gelatinilyticum]|uniref:hypothetical protein n=1 Tax=Flavobacterium gelatinilyticum TaxID=3003260 RepID=UPI00248115D8|nr:hypothetical protein [Flavobacterium gelatinilyticum]
MKKTVLFFAVCFSFLNLNAQSKPLVSNLYKGTVDGKTPVTFYIKAQENQCIPDVTYIAMYRYKSNKWIYLDVTQNRKVESEFIMIEHGFSGALIVKKAGNTFSGLWISTDAKKQLKIDLKEIPMTKKELQEYEAEMERVSFENNDC